MESKGGNMEGDLNKDSRPDEEIKLSIGESKNKEEVTNMEGPDKNDNVTIVLDHSESELKQEKDRKDKEHIEESNHVKDHHDAANGDIEMKFVLDNKHLHTALSIPGSRPGTPNTARKRKNRHLEEMNMAEMISLSGVESMCTISNYDGMSTRGFDDDEEGGEEEEEVDKGIGVHHVLSVLLAMMSVAIVLLLYFLVPCPMEPENWSVQMEGIVSSSPVRLLDVNRDGMDDVIFGFSIGKSTDPPEVKAQLCENLNLSSSCSGGVIAMSGWRGEVLWRLDMNHTNINSLVCNQLDVNKDGQLDCLAAGRDGLLMAINTKTGAILWEADPSVTVPAWTYSQPQTLPEDLDDDGVLDLVVSHGVNYDNISEGAQGGDEVGRLLLLSGKTGQSLGTYLEMLDGHASVSPPIVFQASDDQDDTPYIVFGSGTASGTVSPGSMWMVSLERLLCHVTGSDCITHSTPSGEQQETIRTGVSSIDDHVIELVRGNGDGFILPAIVVDMTMDGVNDLIIISHDALVTAINGSSFKPLWSIQLDVDSEYRPYSVSAPGHFNDDEIPDLMVQLGPHQSASNTSHANKIVILDGVTGGELWHTLTESSFENQPTDSRPSPLSLRARGEKDAFTFWIEHHPIKEVGTTTQSNIDGCSDLISKYPTLNLVMMDRDMAMDPPSLLSIRPYKPIRTTPSSQPSSDITTSQPISIGASSHMTSPSVAEASSPTVVDVTPLLSDLTASSSIPLNASSSSLSSSSTSSPQRLRRSSSEDCMMMEPILESTGIIGDFDDDDSLELIVAFNTMPTYLGSSGSPTNQPQAYLTIQRVSLEQALDQNKRVKLVQADSFLSPSVENSTVSGNIFDHFDLLETKFQTWLGYLGTKADGRYT
eukprot:XP_003728598.1 PREDICTED: uncharacterized protein KIAA1467 [Strongylocentrotus purpuratus]